MAIKIILNDMRSKVIIVSVIFLAVAGFHSLCQAQEPRIQSQWNGAKVAFLGDSITDEAQLKSQDIYWHQLATILGIKPFCYGINGHQTVQVLGQAEKLLADRGQDIDAIIIFIGTNDFNSSIPPGEWYEEETAEVNRDGVMTTLKHRVPVMEGNTTKANINRFMAFLKHNYPTKQVILLTPVHRGYFNCYKTNIQPEESFANPIGLYIDDYIKVIKEVADVWAVPVIDLASVSGLYPMEPEHARYFRESGMTLKYSAAEAAAAKPGTEQGLEHHDLLHPNTEGHLRMAYALAYQLLGYPVF